MTSAAALRRARREHHATWARADDQLRVMHDMAAAADEQARAFLQQAQAAIGAATRGEMSPDEARRIHADCERRARAVYEALAVALAQRKTATRQRVRRSRDYHGKMRRAALSLRVALPFVATRPALHGRRRESHRASRAPPDGTDDSEAADPPSRGAAS